MASLRRIMQTSLGKTRILSIREDVMGVYGTDNPQNCSMLAQLDPIQNRSFMRVALVAIRPMESTLGQNNNRQRDLDNATPTVVRNHRSTAVAPDSFPSSTYHLR